MIPNVHAWPNQQTLERLIIHIYIDKIREDKVSVNVSALDLFGD